MNTGRILASLGMVVFVGAIAIGATGAFFSDTETSTGNTFAAGAIDLRIDNTSYVTDCNLADVDNCTGALVASPNNTWQLSDLTNQLFFSFIDLKPGDIGEDTISIHVGSNDAWACMAADLTSTPDNGINEPEGDAGDVTDGPTGGELQNFLSFTFWEDDGDNVYEVGETIIPQLTGSSSVIFDGDWLPIADSQNGPALVGDSTSYIGKAWCFGTLTPAPVAQGANTSPLVRGTGFTCNGAGENNIAQTDSIVVDVSFYAEQSRNNGQFLCSSLPPFNGTSTPTTTPRAEIGAELATYVAPVATCDAFVDDSFVAPVAPNFLTIQGAINDATTVNGETICVAAGSYGEDVNITKEVELAGAGAASTFIVGQAAGEPGAVAIAANNVTVRGFDIIDAAGGIAALRINGPHSGILVNSNRLRANGANAFLTNGGVSSVDVTNNVLDANGAASQLAYVNGTASVAVASSDVDFFENSFVGTMGIAGGVVLGNEATGADITENDFASTLTSTYAIFEQWEDDANVNFNNFNGVGGIKVRDSDAGAGPLDAENNWWGAAVPAGHTVGQVDDVPKEASAFPLN